MSLQWKAAFIVCVKHVSSASVNFNERVFIVVRRCNIYWWSLGKSWRIRWRHVTSSSAGAPHGLSSLVSCLRHEMLLFLRVHRLKLKRSCICGFFSLGEYCSFGALMRTKRCCITIYKKINYGFSISSCAIWFVLLNFKLTLHFQLKTEKKKKIAATTVVKTENEKWKFAAKYDNKKIIWHKLRFSMKHIKHIVFCTDCKTKTCVWQ